MSRNQIGSCIDGYRSELRHGDVPVHDDRHERGREDEEGRRPGDPTAGEDDQDCDQDCRNRLSTEDDVATDTRGKRDTVTLGQPQVYPGVDPERKTDPDPQSRLWPSVSPSRSRRLLRLPPWPLHHRRL